MAEMCNTTLLCFSYFPPLRNYTHPAQTKPHRKKLGAWRTYASGNGEHACWNSAISFNTGNCCARKRQESEKNPIQLDAFWLPWSQWARPSVVPYAY